MNSRNKLANRFREVLLNGTWVANTNYKEELTNINWKTATTQLYDLNTIAILAQHINYYIEGVHNVFKGGNLEIRDSYSFDFPPITSQEQWENFLKLFLSNAQEFANAIEQLSEKQLTAHFVDKKYGTYLRNIDGMIEHCYYHLGQIVLIKKMLQN